MREVTQTNPQASRASQHPPRPPDPALSLHHLSPACPNTATVSAQPSPSLCPSEHLEIFLPELCTLSNTLSVPFLPVPSPSLLPFPPPYYPPSPSLHPRQQPCQQQGFRVEAHESQENTNSRRDFVRRGEDLVLAVADARRRVDLKMDRSLDVGGLAEWVVAVGGRDSGQGWMR